MYIVNKDEATAEDIEFLSTNIVNTWFVQTVPEEIFREQIKLPEDICDLLLAYANLVAAIYKHSDIGPYEHVVTYEDMSQGKNIIGYESDYCSDSKILLSQAKSIATKSTKNNIVSLTTRFDTPAFMSHIARRIYLRGGIEIRIFRASECHGVWDIIISSRYLSLYNEDNRAEISKIIKIGPIVDKDIAGENKYDLSHIDPSYCCMSFQDDISDAKSEYILRENIELAKENNLIMDPIIENIFAEIKIRSVGDSNFGKDGP